MAKERTPIPPEVAANVLYAADRTCCVCNLSGKSIQLHHINEDPSDNESINLAVLCLECHDQTQIRGGFGRRLDSSQVIRFRDAWNDRVKARRVQADSLYVRAVASLPREATPLSPIGLRSYIQTLPELRRLSYAAAAPSADSGTTYGSLEAAQIVLEVLKQILVTLSRYRSDPSPTELVGRDLISEEIANRARWHRFHHELGGLTGTMVGPMIAAAVIADAERMVEDLVTSLGYGAFVEGDMDHDEWLARWRQTG